MSRARSSHSSDMSAALVTGHDGSAQGARGQWQHVEVRRQSTHLACGHAAWVWASTVSKKDHVCSCAAAPVAHLHHVSILRPASHPTAYSPRRRPLRASRDESRKSEHDTIRGLNAATRDMAAIAEAARCAASKWAAKKASHHAPGPFNGILGELSIPLSDLPPRPSNSKPLSSAVKDRIVACSDVRRDAHRVRPKTRRSPWWCRCRRCRRRRGTSPPPAAQPSSRTARRPRWRPRWRRSPPHLLLRGLEVGEERAEDLQQRLGALLQTE